MLGRTAGVTFLAALAGCAFDPNGLQPGVEPDAAVIGPDGAPPPIDGPGPQSLDAPGPCGDSDNDGVCDTVDRCPGHDDRHDLDGDGNPDDCDDWDCGPTKPTRNLPTSTTGALRGTILTLGFDLAGNVFETSPGGQMNLATTASLRDSNNACPGCNDQLELGWAGGARFDCYDFGNPPQNQDRFDAHPFLGVSIPTSPGVHDVVMHVTQANGCNTDNGARTDGWYPSAPTTPIIASICVR